MKKLLVILCVFVLLIVSVIPANAKEWPPSIQFKVPAILIIDYANREICYWVLPMDIECIYVPEDARINIPGIHGPASFEDLEIGQFFQLGLHESQTSVSMTLTVILPHYYNGQD